MLMCAPSFGMPTHVDPDKIVVPHLLHGPLFLTEIRLGVPFVDPINDGVLPFGFFIFRLYFFYSSH